MTRLIRSAIFTLMTIFFAIGSAFAGTGTTHYVAANGFDTSNGTSESTPWAHLPGMATWTGTYKPAAGDTFILRGCDTWGNANFPIHWTWSGTSTSPITIDRDTTWYNTANCPNEWNRAVFDAGGTNIGSGCGGAGANWMLYLDTVTYVDIKWIEAKGLYWNNDQQNACFLTVGFVVGNKADYNTVDSWYFHGWTHGTSAGTTDTGSAGFIVSSYNTTPACQDCLVTNSVIDNSDSVDGASCATTGSLCSGGGIAHWSGTNNVITNVVEAYLTSIPSGAFSTIATSSISNINTSFTTPSQGVSAPHPNCIETLGGGTFYIHDNYIHNVHVCEGLQVGNAGETDYVWNNVWDMGSTAVAGANGPQVPQGVSGSGPFFFWNNTVRWASGCMVAGGHSTKFTSFTVQNNHCINDSQTVVNGAIPGSIINSNLGMTNANATSQGYTASETYEFSPTSASNATVGTGINVSLAWPVGFGTSDTTYACMEQTLSGVVQSVCPTRTSNPRLTWDIGAYVWSAGTGGAPDPPTSLAASVQ